MSVKKLTTPSAMTFLPSERVLTESLLAAELRVVADGRVARETFEHDFIADQRIVQVGSRDLRLLADDRVANGRVLDHRARADRDVGADGRSGDLHAILDVYRLDDLRVRRQILRLASHLPLLEHRPVRLEQRVDLAGVVPSLDVHDPDLRALVD